MAYPGHKASEVGVFATGTVEHAPPPLLRLTARGVVYEGRTSCSLGDGFSSRVDILQPPEDALVAVWAVEVGERPLQQPPDQILRPGWSTVSYNVMDMCRGKPVHERRGLRGGCPVETFLRPVAVNDQLGPITTVTLEPPDSARKARQERKQEDAAQVIAWLEEVARQ